MSRSGAINEIVEQLGRTSLCQGLSAEEIEQIASHARPAQYKTGQVICRRGEDDRRIFILVRGRCRVSAPDSSGRQRVLGYLGRGDHFGEMALLTDGTRTADVVALLDTELLEFDRESFEHLLYNVPRVAANLSRVLGFRLNAANVGRRRRPAPMSVGLVRGNPRGEQLLVLLTQELQARGERVIVVSSKLPDALADKVATQALPQRATTIDERALRSDVTELTERYDRVLVDLPVTAETNRLGAALAQCEAGLWLVDSAEAGDAEQRLSQLLEVVPSLASNLQAVWLLRPEERVAPRLDRRWPLEQRDLMVELSGDLAHPSRRQWQGMQRLVRHLQGVKIGLALGGGGARGLAHLGVFRAMEEAKLSFDIVAGTSSGAMMGAGYCAGYSCEEGILYFPAELTPSAMFQKVPGGKAWYLWFNFRTGRFDGKLRKFFYDWQFEQLPIPCITMSADLLTGQAIGRTQGDLVHAVLESINLPMISSPIIRDNMALVDGGILNNLPADKLVEHGADLVIGVNVVARLKHAFAGMRPGDPTTGRRPGRMETLLRVTEVQGHGINAIRTDAVDLLVEPETAPFEFADFTKAAPLADAGYEAMAKAIPQIEQLVRDLEQWPV